MTIHLPKEIERDILAEVQSGHYASVDDALVKAWQTLRRQASAPTKPKAAAASGKKATRSKDARPNKPLTIEEIHRQMMASGLITRLPDPALDIDDDDPEDQPVTIKGEPLSETILRERR
jgi:Arc/MetJ-type ribon-helix-helix transcriptional regulator